MKDHIFILLTSVNCFQCKGMRGNGMMGNKTFFMKPDTIKSIFEKSDKIIFLNIHFGKENGSYDSICEISKFTKSGNVIDQEIWSDSNDTVLYKSIRANIEKKEIKPKKLKLLSNKWSDFLKKKIPVNLENYTYFYPCFFICKKDNWVDCIKDKSVELLGITNSGKTAQNKDGKIFLDNSPDSVNDRILTPSELIKEAIDNKIKIHIKNDF